MHNKFVVMLLIELIKINTLSKKLVQLYYTIYKMSTNFMLAAH